MTTPPTGGARAPFNFMHRKPLWFGISALLLVPGLIAMILSCLTFGSPVKLGIDYTGGTMAQLTFSQPIQAAHVREVLAHQGYTEAQVQVADGKTAIVRLRELPPPKRQAMLDAVKAHVGTFQADRFESVGPLVGREVLHGAVTALGLMLLGIMAYIAWRYQLDFALCAIAALAHDVVFLIGTFSLFGLTLGLEVDALFLTALLTVIGFSVHDTIVVYDRLRENMRTASPREAFDDVANRSLHQTLARSINTSLTVVLTLLAMVALGGEPVRVFAIAMLLGIVIGGYSSLFNASQLLSLWRMRALRRA